MSFEEKKVAGASTSADSQTDHGEGQVYDITGEPAAGQTYNLQRNFKARHIQMICLGMCARSKVTSSGI